MPAHPVCRPLSRVLTFIHAPLSQACGVDSYRVLLAEPETSPKTYISTLIERLVDRAKVEAETATHVSPPPLGSLADTEHLLYSKHPLKLPPRSRVKVLLPAPEALIGNNHVSSVFFNTTLVSTVVVCVSQSVYTVCSILAYCEVKVCVVILNILLWC